MPNDISQQRVVVAPLGNRGQAEEYVSPVQALPDPEEEGLKDDEADMEMHESGYKHPPSSASDNSSISSSPLLRWKSRPSMRSGVPKTEDHEEIGVDVVICSPRWIKPF